MSFSFEPLVSCSRWFGAVSPVNYGILSTPGDDFQSCFRILGSIVDTRSCQCGDVGKITVLFT